MKKSIIIIEDDHDIRHSLVDVFSDYGYQVFSAENGETGMRLVTSLEEDPGLIILDLMMPVMDGLTFLEELKKQTNKTNLPVVLFSADGTLSKKAREAGAYDFVNKPIELPQLLELAQRYCD